MKRILSLLLALFLAACAGSNQVPATAVDVPAYALPPAELQNSASPIIRRGQFKGDYLSDDDHPINLSRAFRDPRCLFMKDGFSNRPRNVRYLNADGKDDVNQPQVAIGFHSGNSTCGREDTDERVPYVFVEIAYRLMPNWWFFVAKTTSGDFVHCWLSRRTRNPDRSWCQKLV
jgi:hypothetical protein